MSSPPGYLPGLRGHKLGQATLQQGRQNGQQDPAQRFDLLAEISVLRGGVLGLWEGRVVSA